MSVSSKESTVYEVCLEGKGEYRLIVLRSGERTMVPTDEPGVCRVSYEFIEWELYRAEYQWGDDGDAENGPHPYRGLIGFRPMSYGMGGLSEANVESFVLREVEMEEDLERMQGPSSLHDAIEQRIDDLVELQKESDRITGACFCTEASVVAIPPIEPEVAEGMTEREQEAFVALCSLMNTISDRVQSIVKDQEAFLGPRKNLRR